MEWYRFILKLKYLVLDHPDFNSLHLGKGLLYLKVSIFIQEQWLYLALAAKHKSND